MSSRGKSNLSKHSRLPRKEQLTKPVLEFRTLLEKALAETDGKGRAHSKCPRGVYAFYDYDGEPIYVGQTMEKLGARVGRHLTNQRSDAVAMRILDPFEVAEIELWPLWDLANAPTNEVQSRLDAVEHNAYLQAIENSRFGAILNEKIPPRSPVIELPESFRYKLVNDDIRKERAHPDVRIARRAENISRLAAVAHERGAVSDGLRRVLVVQAVRLAYLASARHAEVAGREIPPADAISMHALVGDVTDPDPDTDSGEPELDLE